MNNNLFHNVSTEHVFKKLSSQAEGLHTEEVKKRQDQEGPNKLPREKSLSGLLLFLRQFKNPLVYILLVALAISFAAGHVSDGLIITIVVVVTNIVSFLQERKANKALTQLNGIIVYKVKVLRDGKIKIVRREELVRGDVIEILAGDMIPADARLFKIKDLRVSEAALTGESMPVKKEIGEFPVDTSLADRKNMIYQGTVATEGSGWAVITAIGRETEIGKVASLIKETTEDLTPLQRQINRFGVKLGIFLVAINILIFFIGVLSGRPIFEMFMISVVIVVSAVPEGLIPAMSIILAIGMQRLSKDKGLVRKAVAAETLGSVSTICVDKTGTLTQGEMLVDRIITHQGSKVFDLEDKLGGRLLINKSSWLSLKIGALSNNAIVENPDESFDKWKVNGNPTERALLLAGAAAGFSRANLELIEPRLDEIQFSSALKMMATRHKAEDKGEIIYIKGAPERILALATKIDVEGEEVKLTEAKREELIEKMDKLTNTGQRIIATAYRSYEKGYHRNTFKIDDLEELTLVGLLAMRDKVRPDVKESINLCRQAGIDLIIITGDHVNTALAIARELDFKISSKNHIEGYELDEMDDEELEKRVREIKLYARVDPRHKLRIVTALQKIGKVVAMTGDGINDAPALKKADIGVAVGNGTDVAKEVADLVLLDNSFMTIVRAVKQGRITFNNIRKVILYLFTDCFQELVIIGTAILIGWPLPILPAQILWIKLVEDPLPATSLSFDKSEEDVMKDKPRDKNQPFLTKDLQKIIAFYAIIMDVLALSLFYYYWRIVGDLDQARSVLFVALGVATLFYIYAIRGLKKSVFRINPFSNKFLLGATAISALMLVAAIYIPFLNKLLGTIPLGLMDWPLIIGYGFCSILVFEIGKWVTRLKFKF